MKPVERGGLFIIYNMKSKLFPLLVLLTALALAATAAYYSVFGISKLFSAQSAAVIVMAGILEGAKLVTASYLDRYWGVINWIRKTYLSIAVIVLMFITSLGIYGFLISAYQETAYKMQEVDKKVAVENMKRTRFQEQLNSITTEKESLNKNITELTNGLANNKIQRKDRNGNIINTTSGSTRRALEKQLDNSMARREVLVTKEQALTDTISKIDLKVLDLETNSEVASEIGPLKYVAKITGQDVDKVVNWFVLLFIFVFDPLAVMLLVSANKALGRHTIQDELEMIDDYIEEAVDDAVDEIVEEVEQAAEETANEEHEFYHDKPVNNGGKHWKGH